MTQEDSRLWWLCVCSLTSLLIGMGGTVWCLRVVPEGPCAQAHRADLTDLCHRRLTADPAARRQLSIQITAASDGLDLSGAGIAVQNCVAESRGY